MSDLAEARGVLVAIAETIGKAVRRDDPTLFYACFLGMPWGVSYVSNGQRAAIQRLLPELARRMDGGLAVAGTRESVEHVDARLTVERACAEIGKRLAPRLKLALFVFKNSVDCPDGVGVNAWFSNLPNGPETIREWLAKGTA